MQQPAAELSFESLPPVYIIASHLSADDLHKAEETLIALNAPLTYQPAEARLVLGNIAAVRRVRLELQWLGIWLTDNSEDSANDPSSKKEWTQSGRHGRLPDDHRGDVSDSLASEDNKGQPDHPGLQNKTLGPEDEPGLDIQDQGLDFDADLSTDKIVVAKLEWLHDCVRANVLLPLSPYVLVSGWPRKVFRGVENPSQGLPTSIRTNSKRQLDLTSENDPDHSVYARAINDHKATQSNVSRRLKVKFEAEKDFSGRTFSASSSSVARGNRHIKDHQPPALLTQTTSEFEEGESEPPRPLPEWVVKKQLYSCERSTPADQPNEDFIAKLSSIRLARILMMDEIGVRAYSTSIAAIAAYPYKILNSKEILELPGCDLKIANLFQEYNQRDGLIQAVLDLENDPVLKVLREFYEIWGVGATTARDFYYNKGWRDLDDVIEFGWQSLSRVQQIGLKYYDEFQIKIPRSEVESIAATVKEHARRLSDPAIEAIIVGGYRRGKSESGDVDVILSHPTQEVTLDLVSQVVRSLEKEGWITHTLTLNLTNSKRNQEPLPLQHPVARRTGFDTLDKALVVWQNPDWSSKKADLAENPNFKNPQPHRRVDIIISPWRTIGCAVAGWTSGTTFQRDLRRYAKKVKNWKFDSSGVRDRVTGSWIDLEKAQNAKTRCSDWKEAERRVFEGLGLVFREPEGRCTW